MFLNARPVSRDAAPQNSSAVSKTCGLRVTRFLSSASPNHFLPSAFSLLPLLQPDVFEFHDVAVAHAKRDDAGPGRDGIRVLDVAKSFSIQHMNQPRALGDDDAFMPFGINRRIVGLGPV